MYTCLAFKHIYSVFNGLNALVGTWMVNKGVFGLTQRYVCVWSWNEELSQQEEDVCSLNIKPTACASLADARLSLLEGSCIHKRMYVGACAHCVCDGVFSLCVCLLDPRPFSLAWRKSWLLRNCTSCVALLWPRWRGNWQQWKWVNALYSEECVYVMCIDELSMLMTPHHVWMYVRGHVGTFLLGT